MPRKIAIPLSMGKLDRVDPKIAPFGSLAVAKNLRVQKDGRLVSRNGYRPLTMADQAGATLVAYDLFEYSNGRLCAMGSSQGEGYPVDIYEYRGVPSAAPWRGTDESGSHRPTLAPFTAPHQVCGIPQPAGGVQMSDCAAGGGYVCLAYKGASATLCNIQVSRELDDQTIYARDTSAQDLQSIRTCFAAGQFWFMGVSSTGAILLYRFDPEANSAPVLAATVEAAGHAVSTTFFELNAVSNANGSAVVVAYGSSLANDIRVRRYSSTGVVQGALLTVAVTGPNKVDIEADEADNTINVLWLTGGLQADLVTHSFAGALLDGPTTISALAVNIALCRLPARAGFAEHVACVTSGSTGTADLVVRYTDVDTHAATATTTVANAELVGNVVAASSVGQPMGIAICAIVEPETDVQSSNALFYVSNTMVHMVTRDLRNSARNPRESQLPLGLSLDTSTSKLAWNSLFLSGLGVESPTLTTFSLLSSERRQVACAGGAAYIAGGPVQIYDGHLNTEACFNEVPGIASATASNAGGSLAPSATYSYIYVFEATLADGTFYESPPSPPKTVTTAAGDNRITLSVHGAHSARCALGDAAYGSEVTGVLYRTVWDAVNGSQGSQFHEAQRFSIPSGLASYGADISVVDTRSDASVATRPVLYTQQGPVEHNAPEAATYVTSSSARVLVSGLARAYEFQESKEQELDESINWSGLSSFIGRAPNPINGAVSLDGVRVLFTRTDVFAVAGDGAEPDASGALPQPVELASPGGLKDWRSLLKGPDGVWAQFDDSKLYRLPRGAGSPEWLGVDVQDTLRLFPAITGACRARVDDALAFAACNGDPGTDTRILVRSLRTGLWTEDTPPLTSASGVRALSSFGDRLAYVSGGVVYAQDSGYTDGAASVIVTQWRLHPVYPFEVGGNGKTLDLQVTGEWLSAGDLSLRVSYDDGATFPDTYDTFTMSGFTPGQTKKRRWSLQRDDIQSIVIELTYTPSAPGAGFIASVVTLLVDPAQGLEDLDPEEMA